MSCWLVLGLLMMCLWEVSGVSLLQHVFLRRYCYSSQVKNTISLAGVGHVMMCLLDIVDVFNSEGKTDLFLVFG